MRRLMLNLSKALMALQFLHRENFVKWQDDLGEVSTAKVGPRDESLHGAPQCCKSMMPAMPSDSQVLVCPATPRKVRRTKRSERHCQAVS